MNLKIKSLPHNLDEAINCLEKSTFIRETLGDHIFKHFITAKRKEWNAYIAQVPQWEIDEYLTRY